MCVCVCAYTTTSGRSRANGICLSDVRKRYSLLMKRAYYYCSIEYTLPEPRFYMRSDVRMRTSFEAVLRASQRRTHYSTGNALARWVSYRRDSSTFGLIDIITSHVSIYLNLCLIFWDAVKIILIVLTAVAHVVRLMVIVIPEIIFRTDQSWNTGGWRLEIHFWIWKYFI